MAKRRIRYREVHDGEWFTPRRGGWRMACCDCGLVHRVSFRVVRGQIQVRVYRDARATAGRRRRAHACQCGKLTVRPSQ